MATSTEQQFGEVVGIILQHRSKASRTVNEESLLTAWQVGNYVSAKLRSEEWGSKVVTQLAEYIRAQHPELKGYGRSNIYNMVMFFDEYSSEAFWMAARKYLAKAIVQPRTGQFPALASHAPQGEQSKEMACVQPKTGQMPDLLLLTTLTNHIEILYPLSRSRQCCGGIRHEPQPESNDGCGIQAASDSARTDATNVERILSVPVKTGIGRSFRKP